MGQPTPPGDGVPLYEGLDASWNDIVGGFPEDKRAELAPKLKSRLETEYEPLRAYEDFHRSGVKPDQISGALSLYSMIENNPRQVYDAIGNYLGLTAQEVKQAAETMQEEVDDDDPRIATMQRQLDTLTQIALAQRQQVTQQQQQEEQDAAIDKELKGLAKKYGDVDEQEVLMRMLHLNMTAEQAYQDYTSKFDKIRQRRPSPMVLGAGGNIPANSIDPTKLSPTDTKSLVANMMQQAAAERKQ